MLDSREFDVIIIGGGVVGTSIARELSRYTTRTCLIEKEYEVSFGVSKANSGIVHAGLHAPPGTLKGCLCARGNFLYGELQKDLDIPFKRTGELVVIRDESEFDQLEKLKAQGEANGVPDIRILKKNELKEIEPNLSDRIVGALLAPTAGVINPYELVYMLVNNAQKNGVVFKTGEEVVAINGDTVRTTHERYKTRFVINAAGLYGDRIANMVGIDDFEIKPRKGQEYLLDKKCRGIVRHVIFPLPTPTSKGTLVIPTLDGTVMVGPSAEDIDDKTELKTTNEVLEKIFTDAGAMVPSISRKNLISAFAGSRPVATGNDFIIGKTKVPGFINVAGIQSPGLTSAPAIAEMVVGILKDEGLKLQPKIDFVPTNSSFHKIRECCDEELEKLIEVDSDYGAVVCRCECVSEAEIRNAIRNGAVTMDGIKFRTRAGMGRCQGGFCSFRTMEILCEETGMSPLEITKKGPGGEILVENIGSEDE